MCSRSSERALVFYSYMCGTLAATPFLWWFIFKSLYSFALFTTQITAIFYWSIVPLHGLVLCLCFLPATVHLRTDNLKWMCLASVIVTVLCATFAGMTFAPVPIIPGLYILNLLLLAPYVVATARVTYLAPPVAHRYYELGFCGAFMVYYVLIFRKMFLSRVFWLPFVVFLIGGIFALRDLETHPAVMAGLQRRRAVFTVPCKHVKYSWRHVWELCARDICMLALLVAAVVAGTLSAGLVTNSLVGLNKYLSLFCVGMIGCLGVSFSHPRTLLIHVPLAAVLLALVHVLGPSSSSPALGACLFVSFYLVMLEAIGCVVIYIRQKLSRAINGPELVLALCTTGNLVVTLGLSIVPHSPVP
ncbi:ORF58 [Retroperitoneal fibromatosis-associated herpesvirus]|uniref:ORF58 n=1 Tax=Retroperitoneal fibromatosis-associated herpesvirus TaxID=111469 RepID=U5NIY9_9GAMA|nr:ORF58 [Retroperitoneal fibromatosis-associated herpesvirus]AGY30744.1 ORF58 [Retroperitoneal fibromatosis-associated herpesvirus]